MDEKRIVLSGGGPVKGSVSQRRQRLFLVSPADSGGTRAKRLIDGTSPSELAKRLRNGGAPIQEVFCYMSSLYFRSKLEYAKRFANPPEALAGVWIITPTMGLRLPEALVTAAEIAEISRTVKLHRNPAFVDPLERDARRIAEKAGANTEVVLLGSIATLKYLEPLARILGDRLVCPREFAGLGNMSRGGLLLRCCREGQELEYMAASSAMEVLQDKKRTGQKRAKAS